MENNLTPKAVSQILGVGLSKTYQLLLTGTIRSVLISQGRRKRTLRVRPSDLEKFMKAREISGEVECCVSCR